MFVTRRSQQSWDVVNELTNVCVFLLSDMASYVNGEVMAVDAGEWLKGAGQFNFMEQLTDAEWAAMNPKKRGG